MRMGQEIRMAITYLLCAMAVKVMPLDDQEAQDLLRALIVFQRRRGWWKHA